MRQGKTFQTLAFLGSLMKTGKITCSLILCPVSCMANWEREAKDIVKHCKSNTRIMQLSSNISSQRRKYLLEEVLSRRFREPLLVIASHGLATEPMNLLCKDRMGDDIPWDYVVIDEGHKIKNASSKTTKGCYRICRSSDTHRLLLTGTPIQNNLKELHTLFDWATSGSVLGDIRK